MRLTAVVAVIAVLSQCAPLGAAPLKVRLLEGNTRDVLVLRSLEGEPIGHGELRQTPHASVIESRLVLTFKDGSLRGETATFSRRAIGGTSSASRSSAPAGTGTLTRARCSSRSPIAQSRVT
jgi:hypothetical protein